MNCAEVPPAHRFCVAPMIDWTDRHCRYFHRLLSPHALLYTEMITTGALLKGKRTDLLNHSPEEHPIALQLGGASPADLAESAAMGEDYGYGEINLNCGCPSDRVQQGAFGACLMNTPELVAETVAAMSARVTIPVTIKCRIGVDESEDYVFLEEFIRKTSSAGCSKFIIHARKAWLQGLSPKENREIPPLDYNSPARIKQDFPHLTVILNGGIQTLEQIQELSPSFDGFMIGREAYQNPWFLTEGETHFWGTPPPERHAIAHAMIPYIEQMQRDYGSSIHSTTRHILGLFGGLRGAKGWRRELSENAHDAACAKDLIESALSHISLELISH